MPYEMVFQGDERLKTRPVFLAPPEQGHANNLALALRCAPMHVPRQVVYVNRALRDE